MKLKRHVLILALAGLAAPTLSWATNGYFAHGYGTKAKGMGGAATATASDTFGGANNPASMVWVGNRLDLGAELFSPQRETNRVGGGVPGAQKSEDDYFLIPEFGYNRMLNSNLSVGLTVYGNGGMNTDYPVGGYVCGPGAWNALCGTSDLGVDLSQLIIAPTVAYKVNASHSIGISPLFAYQRFKAYGLDAFSPMTNPATPGNAGLTNQGYDDSTGWGVRIGWMGKLSDKVSVGAAYASKMDMSKFDKYNELFAEQGDFDIPENYNLGIAFQAMPQVNVALDYQRINYGDVNSIGNPSAGLGGPLGAANGPGFGWQDVNVWKLGVEYAHSKSLTLRAGWNHGDNPIRTQDVTFNILAPGLIQDHVTLGFTYTLASGSELSMSYMHSMENTVSGANGIMGGIDTIKMYQDSLGVAYSWKM